MTIVLDDALNVILYVALIIAKVLIGDKKI